MMNWRTEVYTIAYVYARGYYDGRTHGYEASGEHPWRKNALTTIDLLLIELIEGE